MMGQFIGALIGRKAQEKIVDAVLDKVDLPEPLEKAIEASVTGSPLGMLGKLGKVLKK